MTLWPWLVAAGAMQPAEAASVIAAWPELRSSASETSPVIQSRMERLDRRWKLPGHARGRRLSTSIEPALEGAFRLKHDASGVEVRVRIADRVAPWASSGDALASSGKGGEPLLVREGFAGIEDYRVIPEPRDGALATYSVELSGAAGVRSVEGVVEILDAGGAPRIRMARPHVLDATGKRVDVTVAIDGCAFDADPSPPWGRTPKPPAAESCDVSMYLAPDGDVAYPILLDPLWSSTEDMTEPRASQAILLGPSGRVLFAGGRNDAGIIASAEMFDDVTGTFAVTSSLPDPRTSFAGAFIEDGPDSYAILTGGCVGPDETCSPTTSTLRFDPDSGTFTPAAELSETRTRHRAFKLSDGRVMLVGGRAGNEQGTPSLASTDLFDPVTQLFSSGPSLVQGRDAFGGTVLSSGGIVVAGGFDKVLGDQLSSVERYDPDANAWVELPQMPSQRSVPTVVELPDQRVLVFGGLFFVTVLKSAIVLDDSGWSSTGSLDVGRLNHAGAILPNGWVLAAGGLDTGTVEATRIEGSPVDATWTHIDPLVTSVSNPAQALLPSGRWLLAGGWASLDEDAIATAQILELSDLGAACTQDVGCATGYCVDSVCCESACEGSCTVCSAAAGGTSDGVCAPVSAGLVDPKGLCADEGGCGTTAVCGEGGQCALHPEGSSCTCSAGVAGECDGDGTCTCTGSACVDDTTERTDSGELVDCEPYRCALDACLDECSGSDDCVPGTYCDRSRRCVDAGELPPPNVACACSVPARGSSPVPLFGLLALLAASRRYSKR